MKLKLFIYAFFCLGLFSGWGFTQCPKDADPSYDRAQLLKTFEDTIRQKAPGYVGGLVRGFFVYDLSDPSNKFIQSTFAKPDLCIQFVDGHVYHFAAVDYENSISHIAALAGGKVKIFNSVNCLKDGDDLDQVVSFVKGSRAATKGGSDLITRLGNFRRYGYYRTVDSYRVVCNFDLPKPPNGDPRYDRGNVLSTFADALRGSLPPELSDELSVHLVEESKANGFFVVDLTEPSNRQTALSERVEFKDGHVYHFAFIDGAYSFSNIAFLRDGQIKIFRNINCPNKGDSLEEVIDFLEVQLKDDRNRSDVIGRVREYRQFGTYAPMNGLTSPACEKGNSGAL